MKQNSFISATYANNLYGKAMTEQLLYGDFEWFNPSHIANDFIKYCNNDGEDCYVLEVDLEYPKELRDKHNDYRLAPELTYVKANSLPPCQVELYKKDP